MTARSRERSHRPVKSVGSRIVRGVTINSTEETSRYHGREGISGRRRLQRGLHQLVSTSGYGLVRLQRVRGDIPSRKFISFHAGIGLIISRSGKLWVEIASRSEEHTSELQSLMRISYAVFCLKKKKN